MSAARGSVASSIYELAVESCRWNTMSPERTARLIANDFDGHLEEVRKKFVRAAEGDEVAADGALASYRAGYERLFRSWLAARGRTASTHVTGGSGFDVARNRKRQSTERSRAEELHEYQTKEQRRTVKRLIPEKDPAVELEKLRTVQATMKAANAIVRKKGLTDEVKIERLIAAGLSPTDAPQVLEPDFAGRLGFAPHTLTSVRGKIKRLEERVS